MAHPDHMTDLKATGGRIRKLRLAAGLSQPELATALGLSSRSTIAGIETGADRAGIELMIAIADYFKVPMDWLLGRDVPPGSPTVGKLIERPDEIAVIDFWHSLTVNEKKAVVTTLRIPLYIPNGDTAA
jgi:transcriptional regulator with XRE-family HTH domain